MTTKKKRFGWPTIVGVIVTIPILWWSLHDIHFGEVLEFFRQARKAPLIGAMVAVAAAIPVRAARWRILLRRENPYLPLAPLYLATSAGFAINNLLPARAGEIARAYAARRLTGVRFSAAITTILMSRVFDGVTLFLILALASFLGALAPDFTLAGVTVARIMQVATVVFAALFGIAAIAAKFPQVFLRASRGVSHAILPDKLAVRIVLGLQGILDSLAVVANLRVLGVVMGWSVLIWAINGWKLPPREHWPEGSVVMEEGTQGPRVVVLLDGRVQIFKRGDDGQERKIAEVGPGGVLGEVSLLHDRPRSATVRAAEPLRVFAMDRSTFQEMVEDGDPAALKMGLAIARVLSSRVVALNDKVVDLLEHISGHQPVEEFSEYKQQIFTKWEF